MTSDDQSRGRPVGVILPRSLSSSESDSPVRQTRPRPPWFAVLLVLMLVAGGLLVVWNEVSHTVGPVTPEPPPAPPAEPVKMPPDAEATPVAGSDVAPSDPEPAEPTDPGPQLLNRRRAEVVLGELLEHTRALEEQGVTEWGGETYANVLERSRAGDQAFREDRFEEAVTAYGEAVDGCETLVARLPEAFDDMLARGGAALEQADATAARRAFDAALMINPASEAAQVGRKRAETIERVTSLMVSGASHEDSGRLAMALTDYREAARLDPLLAGAEAAAQRVSDAIRQNEFTDLMTQGLRSLLTGDLDDAEAHLKRAGTFFPGTPEVNDALFQVEEARRLARIRSLEDEAADAERREAWREAYDAFQQVLAIDPHILSAQEGKERNAARARLQAQMQHYVDRPEVLQSDTGRRAATDALADAKAWAHSGAQWRAILARFEEVVTLATTPVSVVLASDGLTDVDVYKVGRFTPFETNALSLLPGTYTVIGHRNGYKDVRIQVTVPPGEQSVRVPVQCTERIR